MHGGQGWKEHFRGYPDPLCLAFSVRFPFSFWPSNYLHLSRVHLERWGEGSVAVAVALSFFFILRVEDVSGDYKSASGSDLMVR